MTDTPQPSVNGRRFRFGIPLILSGDEKLGLLPLGWPRQMLSNFWNTRMPMNVACRKCRKTCPLTGCVGMFGISRSGRKLTGGSSLSIRFSYLNPTYCVEWGRVSLLNFCPQCGEPKMKRPQFSLRLMMLVIALFAVVLAWWHSESQRIRFDEIRTVKSEIYQLDRYRTIDQNANSEEEWTARMDELRQRLAELEGSK